jgi:hypothetical protein
VSPATAALALLLIQAQTGAIPLPSTLLPPRPHITATRTSQPPVIDGKLDDPAWATAVPSDTFVQHFPDEGAPPSERTSMRVLYDDKNLYIGVDAEQRHAPILRRLARRDSQIPSDGVWIDIDSRRTGVGAFHFAINAAGMLSDGIHFDDTNFSADWDAVWEAKVADTDHGYSIEFRIPLSVLRFSPLPVQDWGFQVRRFIDARQETDDWAFYPRSAATYVPLFGRLDDLRNLDPGHSVELRPFVLGRVGYRAADADSTLTHGWSADGSAGLDAKAHITNELTLDLALNPDFGQVEADTVVLNLSTYETVFPEKRPFFLEGIDVFSTVRPLVYTRRIGQQPATPSLSTGQQLVAAPEPSPLYGAAKLVGTIGARTTVGLISAVTGPNDVEIDEAGVRTTERLVPWTTFNILRVKRKLAANAEVGVLASAANRFETPLAAGATCPLTAVVTPDGHCFNDAYVASTDGRWRSAGGDYAVVWQALATTIQRGPRRVEPDGLDIVPGSVSPGGSLYVGKEGGKHWLWALWQHVAGRRLEFNDIGYLERKNDYQLYPTLAYRTLDPWWITRETWNALQINVRETLGGLNLWREIRLASSAGFRNFWSYYFNVHGRAAYFDDRETGDGTALERPASAGVSGDITSDPRRPLTVWLSSSFDLRRGGGVIFGANGSVSLRAFARLELALLPTAGYESGAPRYFAKDAVPAGTPVTYQFGTQKAASVGTTLRAAYTFTPELSLQFYAQVFLARVHYDPLFTITRPAGSVVHLTELQPLTIDPNDPSMMRPMPDTETATLNVNVVLRWEYRLGSTLFLVYTRAQNPALSPSPNGAGFELRPLLQGRAADNVLMAKLAYWFG